MPETVYVLLQEDVGPSARSPHSALASIAAELHLEFRPLHPGIADPEMRRFYVAEAANAKRAAQVVNRLKNTEGVEAAYVKPVDSLP